MTVNDLICNSLLIRYEAPRDYRIAKPYPAVGQVWVEIGEDGITAEHMIVFVRKEASGEFSYRFWHDVGGTPSAPTYSRTDWPPTGMVLASGPQAPWRPEDI